MNHRCPILESLAGIAIVIIVLFLYALALLEL